MSAYKIIGRLVARKGKTAGLFLPIEGLDQGIYEIREIMGEMSIVRIGMPDLKLARFNGLSLEGLMATRPSCCMTQEELTAAAAKTPEIQITRLLAQG